jgi:hypothetical protein
MVLLDLEEVTLVDLDIVRFLATCEAEGIELVHCSPYIREWINRENERAGRVQAMLTRYQEIGPKAAK